MKRLFSSLVLAGLVMSVGAAAYAKNVAVDLKPFFNSDGIMAVDSTDEEDGLDKVSDGAWASFDAEYFPVGGGVVKTIIDLPVDFTMPDPASGLKNNVEAAGQVIPVTPDKYKALYVAATIHHGPSEDTPIVFTYTDGSTSEATFSMTDWCQAPAYDEVPVFEMDHRVNISDGSAGALNCYLSAVKLPVDTSKTLKSITLPADTDDFIANHVHVFAMTLDTVAK